MKTYFTSIITALSLACSAPQQENLQNSDLLARYQPKADCVDTLLNYKSNTFQNDQPLCYIQLKKSAVPALHRARSVIFQKYLEGLQLTLLTAKTELLAEQSEVAVRSLEYTVKDFKCQKLRSDSKYYSSINIEQVTKEYQSRTNIESSGSQSYTVEIETHRTLLQRETLKCDQELSQLKKMTLPTPLNTSNLQNISDQACAKLKDELKADGSATKLRETYDRLIQAFEKHIPELKASPEFIQEKRTSLPTIYAFAASLNRPYCDIEEFKQSIPKPSKFKVKRIL